jgi:hypothetical protein
MIPAHIWLRSIRLESRFFAIHEDRQRPGNIPREATMFVLAQTEFFGAIDVTCAKNIY